MQMRLLTACAVCLLCRLRGVVVAQVTILWCKECGRYLQPPKHWVRAEPESKELLTFCTKRIKGLQVRGQGGRGRGYEGRWGLWGREVWGGGEGGGLCLCCKGSGV
jgi:hypothetical protein